MKTQSKAWAILTRILPNVLRTFTALAVLALPIVGLASCASEQNGAYSLAEFPPCHDGLVQYSKPPTTARVGKKMASQPAYQPKVKSQAVTYSRSTQARELEAFDPWRTTTKKGQSVIHVRYQPSGPHMFYWVKAKNGKCYVVDRQQILRWQQSGVLVKFYK